MIETSKTKPIRKTAPLPKFGGKDAENMYAIDVPDIQPIVQDFIYPGCILFSGRPKSGKSWLMLQAALGIVEGSPIAGCLQVRHPGKVLYLALEDSEIRTIRRLHKITPLSESLRELTFVYRKEVLPAATGGILQLDEYLDSHPGTRLVVIDTLLAFQRIERKVSGDLLLSDYNLIQPLQEMAAKFDCAIVVVDHSRKMAGNAIDVVSGSTGKTAAPDCIITLKNQSDGSSLLEVIPRDAEQQTYEMRLDLEHSFGWRILTRGEDATMSMERREVIALLEEETLSPRELARQTGRKEGATRMMLKRMKDSGLIFKNTEDKYQLMPGARDGVTDAKDE